MEMSGYSTLVCNIYLKTPFSVYLTSIPQIERFQTTRIPIFLSEYGAKVGQTRVFEETRASYSTQMTRVFSGGCVYESWHNSNGYGLAKMLTRREEESLAYRQSTEGLTPERQTLTDLRRLYGREVVETRQTAWGTLLVLKDFANYKASLVATREVPPNVDRTYTSNEETLERPPSLLQMTYPWAFAEENEVPDWAGIISTQQSSTSE